MFFCTKCRMCLVTWTIFRSYWNVSILFLTSPRFDLVKKYKYEIIKRFLKMRIIWNACCEWENICSRFPKYYYYLISLSFMIWWRIQSIRPNCYRFNIFIFWFWNNFNFADNNVIAVEYKCKNKRKWGKNWWRQGHKRLRRCQNSWKWCFKQPLYNLTTAWTDCILVWQKIIMLEIWPLESLSKDQWWMI